MYYRKTVIVLSKIVFGGRNVSINFWSTMLVEFSSYSPLLPALWIGPCPCSYDLRGLSMLSRFSLSQPKFLKLRAKVYLYLSP